MITQCTKCKAYIHIFNKQICCGIDYLALHRPPEPAPIIEPTPIVEPPAPILKKKRKRSSNQVPKKTRLAVLDRDNHQCTTCSSSELLEVHHLIHRKDGGSHEPANLTTLCAICHAEEHRDEPIYKVMRKRLCSHPAPLRDTKC